MDIYILKDDNPDGGYYCAESTRPDMTIQRASVTEVRKVEGFPADVWAMVLDGSLPVDDLPENPNNDSTWLAWWPQGTTVWTR